MAYRKRKLFRPHSFTRVGCRSPTPSSSVSHQLATEHLQRTNASPVRIGDDVCPEDDVNLESQQERTNQDQPSEPMNPSDEDVNPGGAQEAVTQQEISQLFRELDAVKQALLDHQTQSKNQIKLRTAESNHRRPGV